MAGQLTARGTHGIRLLCAAGWMVALLACRQPVAQAVADVAATPDTTVDVTIAACPGGQVPCGAACLPACATPTSRTSAPSCACRDPSPPPVAKFAVTDNRFCLSVNLSGGSDAQAHARRQFLYQQAKVLGVRTLRWHFLWAQVQPKAGTFDWSSVDPVVAETQQAGLDLLAVVAYGNPWASKAAQQDGNDTQYPPDDPATYANYAAALAAHISPTVHHYEIWNEQNAGYRFWKGEPDGFNGHPGHYATLLQLAAKAIHGVDPQAQVAYGGLFYAPQVILGAEAFLDQSLTALPQLGAAFDAIAYHPYGAYPPLHPPEFSDPAGIVPQFPIDQCTQRITAVLANHGVTGKPHWITELGWPSVGGGDPQQVARWLARAYVLALAQDVQRLCWYTIDDSDPSADGVPWEGAFGLYTFDADALDGSVAQPKPAAVAHQFLAENLRGFGYAGDESRDGARIHAFADAAGSKVVHVLWDETLPVGATVQQDPPRVIQWPRRAQRDYTLVTAVGTVEALPSGAADGFLAVNVRASVGFLVEAVGVGR